MLQKDNLRLGLLLGFGAPLIGLLLYYFFQFRLFTLGEFFSVILSQKSLLTAIVSIALVANAAIFTWYINNRRDRTAKGIFIATVIYAVASLLWRYFS
jgi:hypothetical protein